MLTDYRSENINLEPGADHARTSASRSWFVIVFTLSIALQTAPPAWAWARLGHPDCEGPEKIAIRPNSILAGALDES